MFKKILIAFAVALVAFVVIVSMRPEDFKVSRSASISAPPDKVFAVVNDIHRWNDWSPWAKMDPAMKTVYEGPAQGLGASQSWAGPKAGEGKMTISASRTPSKIEIQLDFLKPFEAHNLVEFTFQAVGQGTQVTWAMSGKNNFIAKAMDLFVGMDKMIGPDFEKGLASLKAMVEAKK